MASKEAKSDSPAESKAAAAETFAFEFNLAKEKIGAATTNKQVKSKVGEAFLGYGAFDQCSVKGDVGEDRQVVVFFARLFGKGQPAWEALQKGEKPTISIYDESVELSQSTQKPTGGGATSGTSGRPKKEAKAGEKKAGGRGRGRGAPRGEGKDGEAKEGKEGEGKGAGAGDKKDGGRGRGRGKKEEKKGPSLQRGRANIGGKLGPVSKVRLAKIEKERKEKERKEREEKGEKVEDEKKEEEEEKAPEPKKAAKAEGKKEGGKKEGGKKEGGKAEGGKKEAGGKKEGAKKGK